MGGARRGIGYYLQRTILFLAVVHVAFVSAASDTVVLTLFPPETIFSSQGQVTRSFDVPATQGAFTLRVVNGDGAGNGAASSASVKINGATVVSNSELNENVQTITKPLTNLLPGANSMVIKVNSEHSAHITVSITGEYLLNVAITEPLSGASIYGDAATVRGSYVTYTGDLSISVNGVAAALSEGTFVASGVPLQTGPNLLTAAAVTGDGIQDYDEIGVEANLPPVAEAGRDRDVMVGSQVTLDGRDSYDREGDLISYGWLAAGAPPGSQAALDDPSYVTPSFVPDLPGIYVFGLVARDGMSDSRQDNVTIGVHEFNTPPTAFAGPDNSVVTGTLLSLDGSESFDPDGSPISFSWTMVDRPQGSAAAPDDPSSPLPLILPDLPGTYRVRLSVSDNQAVSLPDDVVIRSSSPNAPPVAHAGPDRVIPRNSTVHLDGTQSHDANEDPLAYRWILVSRPSGSADALDNAASPTPSLFAATEGGHVYRLIVNDGQADSEPSTVVVRVMNAPPVAEAGPDLETIPGSPVTLDGGGSFDPNGDPIAYQWSIASAPAGSGAVIPSPNASNPLFEPDVEGIFVIRLVVGDGRLYSAPDNVTVRSEERRVGKECRSRWSPYH